jgi:hypothetical protein
MIKRAIVAQDGLEPETISGSFEIALPKPEIFEYILQYISFVIRLFVVHSVSHQFL